MQQPVGLERQRIETRIHQGKADGHASVLRQPQALHAGVCGLRELQAVRIALLYMVKGQISLKQRQAVFKLVG
jgi:hypothetical protein